MTNSHAQTKKIIITDAHGNILQTQSAHDFSGGYAPPLPQLQVHSHGGGHGSHHSHNPGPDQLIIEDDSLALSQTNQNETVSIAAYSSPSPVAGSLVGANILASGKSKYLPSGSGPSRLRGTANSVSSNSTVQNSQTHNSQTNFRPSTLAYLGPRVVRTSGEPTATTLLATLPSHAAAVHTSLGPAPPSAHPGLGLGPVGSVGFSQGPGSHPNANAHPNQNVGVNAVAGASSSLSSSGPVPNFHLQPTPLPITLTDEQVRMVLDSNLTIKIQQPGYVLVESRSTQTE